MKRSDDAWWSVTVESAGTASDSGFVLDGEGPFPDPRSPWQPSGVHAIFDRSARPFLEQLGQEVKQLAQQTARRLVVIAESDLNDPRLIWPQERRGFALDARWSDGCHHALHAGLTGERNGYYEDFGCLADLAKALRNAYVSDGRSSKHRKRHHGRAPLGSEIVPRSWTRFMLGDAPQ
jgi:1,4-alpha-glucan branching enzyme